MSLWDELPAQLDVQQAQATADLTELYGVLWEQLHSGLSTAATLAAIEARARVGIFAAAELAALAQFAELRAGRAGLVLTNAAEQLAVTRGAVVAERAGVVLNNATRNMVSPYARLAAQILVTDAARTGTTMGGIEGGATHKQFVRLRPVREPRAHSRHEGTIRPIDGTWLIAGIEAQGPGDPRLPWSERAWCGHICKYIRR